MDHIVPMVCGRLAVAEAEQVGTRGIIAVVETSIKESGMRGTGTVLARIMVEGSSCGEVAVSMTIM